MATHSSIPCLENPMDGEAWWATVHRVAKSRTRPSTFTFTFRRAQVCMHVQSCLTLLISVDWSLPGSSVHGIFQARRPEWVAISYSSSKRILI